MTKQPPACATCEHCSAAYGEADRVVRRCTEPTTLGYHLVDGKFYRDCLVVRGPEGPCGESAKLYRERVHIPVPLYIKVMFVVGFIGTFITAAWGVEGWQDLFRSAQSLWEYAQPSLQRVWR